MPGFQHNDRLPFKSLKLLAIGFDREPCFGRIFGIYCPQQSEFSAVRSAAGFDDRSSRTPLKSRLVGANCSECVGVPSYVLTDLGRQTMQKGTVKWFNPTKGYGFIRPSTGDKDVFVHISAVERAGLSTLNEGQVIEYELVTNRGKTSAENLKVA
jgi:cold shock protein